ncbi:MAG: hypothetical protein AB1401_00145 [Thermodesulfobacteriota bacterium]
MLEFFIALPIGAIIGWIIREIVSDRLARDRALEAIDATHRNAIELIHINNRKLAGMRLRDAFNPELAKLQHSEKYHFLQIPHILKVALERHQAAINEFRFFLEGDELDSFNKAWDEYHCDRYTHKTDLDKHMPLSAKDIQTSISQIQAILKFTEN